MRNLIRNRNFYLMLFLDACLVVASYLLAYLLRFEGNVPVREWEAMQSAVPYILPFKLLIFMFFGLYRGMWRYTGLVDLFNVLKATVTSSVLIILVILFIYRFEGFPRSVFIIDGFLTFIFIAGLRVGIRLLLDEKEGFRFFLPLYPLSQRNRAGPKRRLLIIGAGDAGEK